MGEWKKTQCDMCAVSCGIEVEIENDEIINVRPDPDSPRTSNYMCRKGRAAKYFVHNEDRLNYPLKKVGDHFERISWQQAYAEISQRANAILKEHGPRAFAFCGGTLASEQSEAALAKTFVSNAIGSQYWYCPIGLEFMGTWWSHGKILGHQMYFTEPDEKRNEVLIFWGSNSYVSHQMADARKIIRRFSQDAEKMVITVDPRLSETARMSDMHIPVRNGTDALFLRALISLILKKGWQHQNYLDRWAGDWDRAKRWYENVDIEGSMRVCGISMELAEKFAHVLTHKKWGMHQDLGVFCSRHNTVACYLLLVLQAVCGVLLMPGGCIVQDVFAGRGESSDENDPKTWRTVETGKFPVLGVYPVAVIPAEIQSKNPDHLRAMFFTQTNPARSYPNSRAMEAAFKDLELMVVVDIVMTETARLADYVLPAKSSYEAYAFSTFQGGFPEVGCWLKHPVITAQIGERREGGMIWVDLAKNMGLLPKIPVSLYRAADKAARTGDRIPYFTQLLMLAAQDKHNEVSFQASPNYVMIPHHFGFTFNGKTIGINANDFTASEDIDELTGNPLLRYIPCRVERVEESA